MIWLTSAATAAGLVAAVVGIFSGGRRSGEVTALEERAAFYRAPLKSTDDDELERLSFFDRIIQPQLARLAIAVAQRTPRNYLAAVQLDLSAAGLPYGLTPGAFVVVRVVAATIGAGGGFAIGALGSVVLGAVFAGVAGVALWLLPEVWLRQSIRSRQRAVRRALPDVVDFLVVAVDAGLGFDVALARVVEKFHNPLTAGFAHALAEVQLGRYRLEALEDFGRRSGVPELVAFIQMVASSQRMGVPIAQVLRLQSQELRWRRGEWARQLASQAPVKMTIPMVVFIFPTLWLVLLGPSFLQILSRGL